MATISLGEYVAYLREHKQPRPRTVEAYQTTLKSIDINEVDLSPSSMSALYQTLLTDKLPKCGNVNVARYLAILSAWIKKNHLQPQFKDINYERLHDELQKTTKEHRAYTDEELNWLFGACETYRYYELKALMLLMLYAGLRISACNNIRWENVQKVDGYPVYTYRVESKGIQYNAICSQKVMDYIRANTFNSPTVVPFDPDFGTPFDKYYRLMFGRMIQRSGLYELRKDTSIFHSFRKSFSQKLTTNPELDPLSFTFKALMGHMPRTSTATKYYIMPDGSKEPLDLIKRKADAYAKSDLMKMTVGWNY